MHSHAGRGCAAALVRRHQRHERLLFEHGTDLLWIHLLRSCTVLHTKSEGVVTCLLSDSLTVSQVMMDSSPTPPDAHGPDRAADCRNDTWQYLFDVDGYIVITGVLSDDESERESVRALLAPLG